jgi:UDP-N-acetylmuramate dehydrogenase
MHSKGASETKSTSPAADLATALGVAHEVNAPLGPWTWFTVGGQAEVLAHPATLDELSGLVAGCHDQGIPMRVLGKGANLLVREGVVAGMVIALDTAFFQQVVYADEPAVAGHGDTVAVQARGGVDLFKLVRETARAGLSGLENVAGIPATVGGAVVMNAGGAFGEIGDVVQSVSVMRETGIIETLPREQITFGYRHTDIAAPLIVEVTFALTAGDAAQTTARMKEIFAYKKDSQPMGDKSAGCAFKNPRGQSEKGAGQLIDEAGLKGFVVGGAHVSERHGNFIVVDPKTASADDVAALIEHVQNVVRDVHGVDLQREVVIWPHP